MSAHLLSRERALAAYTCLAMAVFLDNGHFGSSAIVWMAVAVAASVWLALAPSARTSLRRAAHPEGTTLRLTDATCNRPHLLLLPGLLIAFLLCGANPPGIYLRDAVWNFGYWAMVAVAIIATTTLLRGEASDEPRRRRAFLWLVSVGFAMKVYLLAASPAPAIDVFEVLQGGADALLRGENPYAASFAGLDRANIAIDTYMYPPLTLLVTAPFRWVFGDVRAAFIACELSTFLLLLRLGSGGERAPSDAAKLCALLFLFHPRALFMLEQAWTEPIAALCFVAFLVAAQRRRAVLATVSLGLFFASKQYLAILAPLCALGLWRSLRESAPSPRTALARVLTHTVLALAVAAAVTLPLALWDWRAFVADVWTFHWASPFREDALNFSALLFAIAGVRLPDAAALFGAALGAAAGAWAVVRHPGAAGLGAGAGVALLLALQPQKHAFCNYYQLVSVMFIACAVASFADDSHPAALAQPSGG